MKNDAIPDWPADAETLLPAIVQDADTRDVRMLAWMNRAAYERTVEIGRATFWSRSRERLWTKGETSGNVLEVVALDWDCDADALLVTARATGPTCHTGSETCWGEPATTLGRVLDRLSATVADRDRRRPEGSYTARLLGAGPPASAAKVVEEAGETAIAALAEGSERLAEEAADLLYHLLVLLRSSGVGPGAVAGRLAAREGRPPASRDDSPRWPGGPPSEG